MERGFISIRNEDGTQWLSHNELCDEIWGDWRGRRAFPRAKFEELEARVPASKRNDCPDNGFFGLWNLTWTPCTEEEAEAAEGTAKAYEAECEAEEAKLVDDFWEQQLEELELGEEN